MILGWRVAMLNLGVLLMVVGCLGPRSAPAPELTSLVVHNRSTFDVDVFTVPSLLARAMRVGSVPANASATFPLRSRDLQPGGFLAVQLHAIGTRTSWTSDAVPLSEDEIAVLDVNANSFGDCSASVLYTTMKSDAVPPTPGARQLDSGSLDADGNGRTRF